MSEDMTLAATLPAVYAELEALEDEIRRLATAAALSGNPTLAEVIAHWADQIQRVLNKAGDGEK